VVWSTATAELAAASCRYRTEPASGTPGRRDYGMSLRNVSGQSTTDPRSTARAREPGAQALCWPGDRQDYEDVVADRSTDAVTGKATLRARSHHPVRHERLSRGNL